MNFDLSFEKLINYDTSKVGISLEVELRLDYLSTKFEAKVDTGSTFCIFARKFGEDLGIEIELGTPQLISTSTGSFMAFGHGVTLITAEFELDSIVFFAKDENFNRNVLGRHGWLDRVIVGINDYESKLYLNKYEYLMCNSF